MKRTLRRGWLLFCLILLIGSLPVSAQAASAPGWTLSTLDGDSITENTYADRTQLLVFYRGSMNGNNAVCYNSRSILQSLGEAYWIDDPDVQVITIEADHGDRDSVAAFKETFAPDLDQVVFAYGGSSLMWSYHGYGSLSFSFCVILQDGEVVETFDGVSDAAEISGHLAEYVDLGDDPNRAQTLVTGQYRQTEARSILGMLNDFRTGDQAWYWNSDNETITSYPPGTLGTLTYDYDLEQIAMQRAAELTIVFSHTRPDNTLCFTATANGTGSCGENIAAGFDSAEEVFFAWREDEDDFSGQGHRRNMLNGSFTSVGLACFDCQGWKYWVQEFGYGNSGAAATAANDGDAQVLVDYDKSVFPGLTPYVPLVPRDGLVEDPDGVWRLYEDNVLQSDYTGLAENENGWWYVFNGALDPDYTGLATNENGTFYVYKGQLADWRTGCEWVNGEYCEFYKGQLTTWKEDAWVGDPGGAGN